MPLEPPIWDFTVPALKDFDDTIMKLKKRIKENHLGQLYADGYDENPGLAKPDFTQDEMKDKYKEWTEEVDALTTNIENGLASASTEQEKKEFAEAKNRLDALKEEKKESDETLQRERDKAPVRAKALENIKKASERAAARKSSTPGV